VKRFKPGAAAPDFTLPDETGAAVSLKSFRGNPVVLYFIPKAGSPGCVEQACNLKAALPKLPKGTVVVGVAPDSQKKLSNFKKKHRLPFVLLSDADQEVANRYGYWVEKKMYGQTFMGMKRVTLVLDANGRVVHEIFGFVPREHAGEVAKFFRSP
jgi:peroxiredoxin Q/BCP